MEIAFHLPSNYTPKGLALICHPHPQFGGTMDNKVVQTLHKAFAELGFATMRFNFRGVGASEGVFDNGIGETEDAAAALVWARAQVGDSIALVAAGFSFGCFVQTQLLPRSQPKMLVLIAPAVSRFAIPEVAKDTIVIHGDEDDVVPLADVFAWARPQGLPESPAATRRATAITTPAPVGLSWW